MTSPVGVGHASGTKRSMSHAWQKTVLAPARLHPTRSRPEVLGLVTCVGCGSQAMQSGYGRKAQLFFRESAYHEWSETVPPCRCSMCGSTVPVDQISQRRSMDT